MTAAAPMPAPADAPALDRAQIAAQERARVFRDIHDDIGVKLLALLHTVRDARQADLIRSIIYDLRDIVTRSRSQPGTLLEVLAQVHDEMDQRLEALGAVLDWAQGPSIPDVALAQASALHLFRIMREAVTNAIRHGRAHTIQVRIGCSGERLQFEITDDGGGDPGNKSSGIGTQNMQLRAAALGGSVRWTNEPPHGVRVTLEVPLQSLWASE